MLQVMSKASKRQGVVQAALPTEYWVTIDTNKRGIQLFREQHSVMVAGPKFSVDDIATYDSYNLQYMGFIESISEKTVTIVKTQGSNSIKHRLSIYEFCWRNYHFDAQVAQKENNDMMTYL